MIIASVSDFRKDNSDSIRIFTLAFRRFLIKEKYKTIEQFCYCNDISKGTISEILSNKKLPRIDTLKRITDRLDVQLSDFFKKIKE